MVPYSGILHMFMLFEGSSETVHMLRLVLILCCHLSEVHQFSMYMPNDKLYLACLYRMFATLFLPCICIYVVSSLALLYIEIFKYTIYLSTYDVYINVFDSFEDS